MSTEEDHRKLFKEFCAKKYYGQDGDTDAAARSKAISQARGERIVKLQKDETLTVEPKFRYWVKKKGFKLLSYSLLGLVDVLCLPAKMKVSFALARMHRARGFVATSCTWIVASVATAH